MSIENKKKTFVGGNIELSPLEKQRMSASIDFYDFFKDPLSRDNERQVEKKLAKYSRVPYRKEDRTYC